MRILLLLSIIIASFHTSCTTGNHQNIDSFPWPGESATTKPWTRWWWMGNAVDTINIEKQLTELANSGFGGVEITPIYGVIGTEDRYIDFLSEEWMDILEFTIEKAGNLGMGVDMNLGTGWPFGGPQITPEFAASKLVLQEYELKKSIPFSQKIRILDVDQNMRDAPLIALTAYYLDGSVISLFNNRDRMDSIHFTPAQDGKLIAAFAAKTRQRVKRAAPGGEGWSMDHFSKTALEQYLERFDSAFGAINNFPRAFFNDSYEVYGASATADVMEAFYTRRGYDLRLHLDALGNEAEDSVSLSIRSDYRQTLSELLLEEFTIPWDNWSNKYQSLTRNQAHGSPGNIIDLYAAVDIPECETFGSSHFDIPGLRRDSADIRNVDPDPVMMKFATSPANILGKKLVSSETFTWLAEHFKVSLSQCKPELEQVFLSGVNHVFFHGTTYSPNSASWPGWLFYASVQFGPVNSFWEHIPGLTHYISRCQHFLQKGRADNDLLIYWPIFDVWKEKGPLDMQISIHNIDEWLHPTPFYDISSQLMHDGYLVDFISDQLISKLMVENGMIHAAVDGGKYKTLIIPACELMPVSTFNQLIDLASRGASIVFQSLPENVPGYHESEKRKKELMNLISSLDFIPAGNNARIAKVGRGQILIDQDISKSLEELNLKGESFHENGLKFIRRTWDNERLYYLVNHTPNHVDKQIPFNANGKHIMLIDPDSGIAGKTHGSRESDQTMVNIPLPPGKSIFVYFSTSEGLDLPEWRYHEKIGEPINIQDPWTLTFTKGGPVLPKGQQLDTLLSWTSLDDPAATQYAGTGKYTTSIILPDVLSDDYLLDLGRVAESARIWINGNEAGILWSIPFNIKIGKFLQPGENTITIEIANLMANRIRYMDQANIPWCIFHEINFVNINYKPFDASGWDPMPSGLLGPVTLIPLSEITR